jgi:CBS domain-containing protein
MQPMVLSIDPSVTLRQAARALSAADVGTLAIMDGPELAGIVSERDIVRALAEGADPEAVAVADVMSPDPRYLTLGDSATGALEIMLHAKVRHLPVVDEGELVGILSIRDLARALTQEP